MKTLRDCQDRVAKRFGIKSWNSVKKKDRSYTVLYFQVAAELYGRYMRFVGYYQGKQRGYLDKCIELGSSVEWPKQEVND